MSKYVYIIGTEHQFIQVKASIDHFKISNDDIILLIEESNKKCELTQKIKKDFNFHKVFCFLNWNFTDLLKREKKIYDFIKLCNSEIGSIKEPIDFFVSHYSDDSTFLVLSLFNVRNFFLMDEGTASFNVVRRRQKKEIIFRIKLLIKSFLYGIKIIRTKSIIYFTRFNLKINKKDNIEIYSVIKTANLITSFNNSQVDFLGSSVVELNLMTEKDYINYLTKVLRLNKGKKMIYFKHRKEDPLKLEKLKEIGFVIKDIKTTYENYYNSKSSQSGIICSFFTTSVLINISNNFINTPELLIYTFPINKLIKERKVFTTILQTLKEDKNISIINI
jgi:hypothetical protein